MTSLQEVSKAMNKKNVEKEEKNLHASAIARIFRPIAFVSIDVARSQAVIICENMKKKMARIRFSMCLFVSDVPKNWRARTESMRKNAREEGTNERKRMKEEIE